MNNLRSGALARLAEATAALEDKDAVAQAAAEALVGACPRGLAVTFTLCGPASRPSMGTLRGFHEGTALQLSAPPDVYRRSYTTYDKRHVDDAQRNRWVEPLARFGSEARARFTGSPSYALLRRFDVLRLGRMVVCAGPRPVGFLALFLRRGQTDFSDEERRSLVDVAPRIAAAVRVASLLSDAEARMGGVDHLMARQKDASFLVSPDGNLIEASDAGARLMDQRPELRHAIARAVRHAAAEPRAVVLPKLDAELNVTPCATAGQAAAFLVSVAGHAGMSGRRLSPRQSELLALLDEGLANSEIAERMKIAPGTVKVMLERLYRAAGVSGRVALLRWARGGAA